MTCATADTEIIAKAIHLAWQSAVAAQQPAVAVDRG